MFLAKQGDKADLVIDAPQLRAKFAQLLSIKQASIVSVFFITFY